MARIEMDFKEYSGVVGVDGYGAIITPTAASLPVFNRLVG